MRIHELLGLPCIASKAEVTRAFRRRALRVHPDKGGSTGAFVELFDAYEAYKNPTGEQQLEDYMQQYAADVAAYVKDAEAYIKELDEGGARRDVEIAESNRRAEAARAEREAVSRQRQQAWVERMQGYMEQFRQWGEQVECVVDLTQDELVEAEPPMAPQPIAPQPIAPQPTVPQPVAPQPQPQPMVPQAPIATSPPRAPEPSSELRALLAFCLAKVRATPQWRWTRGTRDGPKVVQRWERLLGSLPDAHRNDSQRSAAYKRSLESMDLNQLASEYCRLVALLPEVRRAPLLFTSYVEQQLIPLACVQGPAKALLSAEMGKCVQPSGHCGVLLCTLLNTRSNYQKLPGEPWMSFKGQCHACFRKYNKRQTKKRAERSQTTLARRATPPLHVTVTFHLQAGFCSDFEWHR